MPLPSPKDQFGALIAASSISCTQPELDRTSRPVIDLLASWLGDPGFHCETREASPDKFNLLASYGSSPGGLVPVGHADTMSYDEALWSNNSLCLDERDGRWYSLGSCDVKGFFPLAIKALLPLLDQSFRQPLMVLTICGEKSSMADIRVLAESERPLGRATVIGEPANLRPIHLHRGMMIKRIEILEQSGRSSDPNPERSTLGAMHVTIGELTALHGEWQRTWNSPQFSVPWSTLNFGCIHGGDSPNRICDQCSLEFSLRPLSGMQPEQLREVIRQRPWPLAERYKASINCRPLLPAVPLFEQAQDGKLVCAAERPTGYRAETATFGIEAPYSQRLGSEILVFGAGNIACAHQPGEHLGLARIEPMVGVLCRLVQHYCLTPVVD